jgi:hypothetical protein
VKVLLDENFPLGLMRVLQADGLQVEHIITLNWRGASDLDGAELMRDHPELFGRDGRARVRIEVHPPDPGARVGGITPCVFPATVELFDNITGQTMVAFENPVNAVSGIEPTPF